MYAINYLKSRKQCLQTITQQIFIKRKLKKETIEKILLEKVWLALIQFSDNSTFPTSAKKLLFFPGSIFYLTSVILRRFISKFSFNKNQVEVLNDL